MKIYDSVHGFIHFDVLEGALIDTEVFQRLHYIHQLGISYMVYPGGTHTRFEHSLGTMHLATQIFDQISSDQDRSYWRLIVRFAALCHDLGHLPFSHVAEKMLLRSAGHEEWTLKLIESSYLEPVWAAANKLFPGHNIALDVAKLALGEEKMKELKTEVAFTEWERVYSQIITGDFVGADRMDYLLRDSKATGLSYGLFDYMQLIEMLTVLPDEKGSLTVGVEENGIESCEALLLARHFMQRRVYQYPTAKAYSFHMARFMKTLYGENVQDYSVDDYTSMTEYDILSAIKLARVDSAHPGHHDAISLFDRKKRFQAIHLPHEISLDILSKFKEKGKIPDSAIHWDMTSSYSLKSGLSLPILRKNEEIGSAKEFSEIEIPTNKKSWLYLSPEYAFKL